MAHSHQWKRRQIALAKRWARHSNGDLSRLLVGLVAAHSHMVATSHSGIETTKIWAQITDLRSEQQRRGL